MHHGNTSREAASGREAIQTQGKDDAVRENAVWTIEAPGQGPLSCYRILDLTDERGILAGHLLARLGADVIQIEPPGGSPARLVPPFDEREGHARESLFWKAFAAGKRSVVLDLETAQGRADLLRLVAQADVLIESAAPGTMEALGLGYEDLRRVNPRLVHVSITPYGATGPKSGYADSDLTVWAAAGPLALTRAATGQPLRIAFDQTFHQAAGDAACGTMMALLARGEHGAGQRVEVSAQASNTLCTLFGHLAAPVGHENYSMSNAGMKQQTPPKGEKVKKTDLDLSGSGARTNRTMWDVRDGTIEMHIGIGTAAGRFSNALFRWLREIGECPAEWAEWDWIAVPDRIEAGEITMDDVERARDHAGTVLARYSKNELVLIAERHGLMLAPILTTADLSDSPQLLARDFFVPGEDGDLMMTDPFNGCGEHTATLRHAPAPGEHTAQVLSALTQEAG